MRIGLPYRNQYLERVFDKVNRVYTENWKIRSENPPVERAWNATIDRADALADADGTPRVPKHTCRHPKCGQYEVTHTHLDLDGYCFSCHFWSEKVGLAEGIRIDGTHYMHSPEDPKRAAFRGFGGRAFHIRMFTGEEFITTNLWHQGEIPAHWRDALPDNAIFLTTEGV